ncbi:hypothetical protein PI125_g9176 [Phytophthora idaei]|nr:hypothetical protein PI125_g9176 [Phytophthora idaei]
MLLYRDHCSGNTSLEHGSCEYLETALPKKLSELEENVAFVVGFIVLHRSLGLLALRFVNLQKK